MDTRLSKVLQATIDWLIDWLVLTALSAQTGCIVP